MGVEDITSITVRFWGTKIFEESLGIAFTNSYINGLSEFLKMDS